MSFFVGITLLTLQNMKQAISLEQYETDFKQVVLYNSVYSIDRYFGGEVASVTLTLLQFYKAKLNFLEYGELIPKEEFHDLLQQVEKLNYALSLPKDFVKAMFHKRDGKQKVSESIKRLTESGEIFRWNHGVLKTKTATKHFGAKYLANVELIASIFADKELLAKVLDFKSDFYTKRQYRFISKLKNIKQQKEKTMIHNDEEPVFINPQQAYSRRRMTKAQREKLNEDIPDEPIEVETKIEVAHPVPKAEPVSENFDKLRELDKLMFPFRKRILDRNNPITEDELKMKEQEFRKELGL